MGLKETLDLIIQYPQIKSIKCYEDQAGLVSVEFFEPREKQTVVSQALPMTDNMPPDDVMLFAATENVDELLKQRQAE